VTHCGSDSLRLNTAGAERDDAMPVTDDGVEILPVHECWDLLRGLTLGRLVTHADGQPDIFPVNYVVQRRTVLFRTAEGTKLISAAINNRVLFEVDDHNVAGAWTVIIRGIARSLRTTEEIEEAERAQVLPWTRSEKTHYVRIVPESVTGRRFRFGSPAG
jgi:nitroimidazol reductase NimA-like FMN-containing flavoprotein (pyridoxamine 5'-phosphate oxidase superfamily)